MHWRFGPFLRSIETLELKLRQLNLSGRIVDNRSKFPIVVIYDKDFKPIKNLQRYNFSVTHLPDIHSIDVVARYPIVLSDLLGVGLSFGPKLQGAQVIKEITPAAGLPKFRNSRYHSPIDI